MTNVAWRKRLSVWSNRFYLYPAPEPLPRRRSFWLAMGLVTLLVVLYSLYFIIYLISRHTAYLTNAEDLGIMDQAIWNTLHGQILHQTICNILHDTNCYGYNGISRFAIHFEPILFPISLLYLFWPGPRTLLVVQTLIVASGAFPAFWLARLRLRNEFAGVAIAALYLLYPAQQEAAIFDFHAVTFTAALLLFMLYCMYTRRTAWLFVFAILAMACKEEIPFVVAVFGLWSVVFQRRWRSGLALVGLALAWTGIALLVLHIFSPSGHSLLTSRYSYLGSSPLKIALNVLTHPVSMLKQHVLEHNHFFYLRSLLSPAGYLPLLAPWVMVLALPTLALNLLSTDPGQYSGLFQYNAEIVPVLIFSVIEAMVLILWAVQQAATREDVGAHTQVAEPVGAGTGAASARSQPLPPAHASHNQRIGRLNRLAHGTVLILLLVFALGSALRADRAHSSMPFAQGFLWPHATPHTELAQRFINMIPPDATVSAMSGLVPHLSHRSSMYLFPYGDDRSDYILLDVTGDIYPFYGSQPFIHEVKKVLLGGKYGILAAQDGYLLLKRGLPPPGISPYSPVKVSGSIDNLLPNLPAQFCSYVQVTPQQVLHPLDVTFQDGSADMRLVGYSVAAANPFSDSAGYMQVTTFWQASGTAPRPLQVLALLKDVHGAEHQASTDFPAATWCTTNSWHPGTVYELKSRIFSLGNVPNGLAHVSIALVPLTQPYNTIMDVAARVPFQIVHVPATVTATQGTNALQLDAITIIR